MFLVSSWKKLKTWPDPTIRRTTFVRAFSHSFGLFLSNAADALPAVGRLLEKAKVFQSEDQPTFF